MKPLTTFNQADPYSSPWSVRSRLKLALWMLVWSVLYRPTPKPLFPWRVFLLKLFGCQITGKPYVASTSKVKFPWKLTLEDRACLGDYSNVYNLGHITLKARCVIAQEVYLCAGTHDFADPILPLQVAPIIVGEDVFVGVRAVVLPGVEIGAGAVVGGGSVVTKDLPSWTICAGNPCRPLKPRIFKKLDDASKAGAKT